ncbi:MAG: YitT family protein [Thermodesulfobacteriota bacterium]
MHINGYDISLTELLSTGSKNLVNLSLIALGSLIFIIGLNGILVPHGFLSGGVVGLSILIHYLFPLAGVGVVYFLLNIPLVFLGWFNISRRFMIYTLFGTIFFSVVAATFYPKFPEIKDPILAALSGGVICGSGAGLILRSLGSAGGTDIIAVYLYNKFGLRIGLVTFTLSAVILLMGAFLYDLQMTLYSLIYLYTQGKITDAIMVGFNQRKTLMVVSDHVQTIARKMVENGRTATFFKGVGAYSGNERNVLYTVANFIELAQMKDYIFKVDPEAFVVVYDTLEILGKRYGTGRIF